MNSFTAIVKIASSNELRYTGDNQTAIVNPKLELMSRFGSGDSFHVNSVAWGKVAEKIGAMKVGSVALVTGQLNILRVDRDGYKESIASVKISEVVATLDALIPFNQVSILGNVGQEVDAKWFESGKNNAKFSLAVRRTKDETNWFAIETWGDAARVASQYVAKGSKVGINGHLKLETWTDKDTGMFRSKPVIVGDRLDLAGKNSGGQSDQYSEQTYQAPKSTPSSTPPAPSRSDSASAANFDDIPF